MQALISPTKVKLPKALWSDEMWVRHRNFGCKKLNLYKGNDTAKLVMQKGVELGVREL